MSNLQAQASRTLQIARAGHLATPANIVPSVASSLTSWRVVEDSLAIHSEDILRVRFSGTRFTGTSPWVDVVYRTPDGPRFVSFADQSEARAVDTYNRIFAAVADLWAGRTTVQAR